MEENLQKMDCNLVECDEWERSGDILQDELKMYIESYLYDCTFRVGEVNPKIFKCHKLILARASRVFQKMLFGNFQESAKDKDDPIMLKDVLPEAFDLVMRYIYGNEKEFHSIDLACEVYKFGHEWQMDGLMRASAEKLKFVDPKDVLLVYETLKHLGCDLGLVQYREIIFANTSEVLQSPYWTKATLSTIEEIFKSDKLKINCERELFEGLLNWGLQNTKSKIDSAIRSKIDSALKLIRFRSMSAEEFSELCIASNILCEGEKLQILLSINLGDAKYMPESFSICNDFREYDRKVFLDFKSKCLTQDVYVNEESTESCFKFFIDGKGSHFLTGIENDGLEADLHCSLENPNTGETIARARFKGKIDSKGDGRIDFAPPVPLREKVRYTLSVRYSCKLFTKKFDYSDVNTHWVWSQIGTKIFHSTCVFSHTDISFLHLIKK